MKILYIVEKTDNHGEFQPMTDSVYKARVEAVQECERFVKAHDGVARFRVMEYARIERR